MDYEFLQQNQYEVLVENSVAQSLSMDDMSIHSLTEIGEKADLVAANDIVDLLDTADYMSS